MATQTKSAYPLFEASGCPKLPENMSCEAFEKLLKNWNAQEGEQIQTYLKSLDAEAQTQAIAFMQQMDEEAKRQETVSEDAM